MKSIRIENLSCEFKSNKISVIMGESGCGKTTLLKTILGQLDYTGKIYFDEVDCDNLPTNKRNISYVSSDIILYPHLTVFDNIAFPLKVINCPKDEILKSDNPLVNELLGENNI